MIHSKNMHRIYIAHILHLLVEPKQPFPNRNIRYPVFGFINIPCKQDCSVMHIPHIPYAPPTIYT